MGNKEYRNNSIKHKCNVPSIFRTHTTRAISKSSNYSSILQGCMNTCSRKAKFKNFRIILVIGSSSLDGFQHILIMIMSHLLTSSIYFLISGIGGGSICACQVTTCEIIYGYPRPSQYMITKLYPVWLSAEVQAQIEPPPIPLTNN